MANAHQPSGDAFLKEVSDLKTHVDKWVHELKDHHPVPKDVKSHSETLLKELKGFARGELADHVGILANHIHNLAHLEHDEDKHHPQKHDHAVDTAERKLHGQFEMLVRLAKRMQW
jgi:hypothetical protein